MEQPPIADYKAFLRSFYHLCKEFNLEAQLVTHEILDEEASIILYTIGMTEGFRPPKSPT